MLIGQGFVGDGFEKPTKAEYNTFQRVLYRRDSKRVDLRFGLKSGLDSSVAA